jgi:hypothetical protein
MTAVSEPTIVEVRCPVGARSLLMKVRLEGGTARRTDGNLLELSCRDCTQAARRRARANHLPEPVRILHRFDVLGQLIESDATYQDD